MATAKKTNTKTMSTAAKKPSVNAKNPAFSEKIIGVEAPLEKDKVYHVTPFTAENLIDKGKAKKA